MQTLIKWILSFLFPQSTMPAVVPQPISSSPIIAPIMPVETTLPAKTYIDSKWGLVPELVILGNKFFAECESKGYFLKITQGLRTAEQQAALYAQGRTTPGVIVTNAKAGQSYHETGKAFDVCFEGLVAYPVDDAHWKAIADIGISCGLTPGYYFKSFKDMPHFQI